MAVVGGLAVDRAAELETVDDRRRTQVEVLLDQSADLLLVHLRGAERLERELDGAIAHLSREWPKLPEPHRVSPILHHAPGVVIRSDGDKYLLIEFGDNVLDFKLRFRVHALEKELRALRLAGIIDITPGVRSLHVHYDTRKLSRGELLEALRDCKIRILSSSNCLISSGDLMA